jgi:predicted dehydrogenase
MVEILALVSYIWPSIWEWEIISKRGKHKVDETAYQNSGSSRRDFLKSVGAGLALSLAGSNPRALGSVGANDRIQMGFIGLGSQGTGRLMEFMQHADVDVAGVCDVDEHHLERAAVATEKARGHKPKTFRDFRALLDQPIDAVMIATPDHWHALPAIRAFQAGKDVFVEKPLSYSIGEGRAMVTAAHSKQRVSQVGMHIHNHTPNYRRAVELVKSGMLGQVSRVTCWMRSTTKGLGNPPDGAPPPELDYDFWLGPAPKRAYNPNRSHGTFRYFWDYSGGIFIDFWCHITDVVFWALDLKAPESVAAVGGRYFLADNTETPDTLDLVYEFPKLDLTWTLNPTPLPGFESMGSIGCVFQGTEASLAVNYMRHELYVKGKPVKDFQRPAPTIPDSPGHIREFLDAIKSRQPTTCNVEYAHRLTKSGLLGNIAYRTGRRIRWDDERERVIKDPGANRLVTRRYRKPWKLA